MGFSKKACSLFGDFTRRPCGYKANRSSRDSPRGKSPPSLVPGSEGLFLIIFFSAWSGDTAGRPLGVPTGRRSRHSAWRMRHRPSRAGRARTRRDIAGIAAATRPRRDARPPEKCNVDTAQTSASYFIPPGSLFGPDELRSRRPTPRAVRPRAKNPDQSTQITAPSLAAPTGKTWDGHPARQSDPWLRA